MATNVNCSACEELRQSSADFVVNGVNNAVCASLKNNTGFNPSSGHNDCTDLDAANDCLVGNLVDEIEAEDNCNWKDFAAKALGNIYQVIKAIICALCGIWTNITSLWTKVNKHDCEISMLTEGYSFRIGEDETDGSYVVAGKGVSYLTRSSADTHSTDIRLVYIGGALCYIAGGLEFFTENWQEPDETKVWNFDNGGAIRNSYNRSGNEYWNSTTNAGDTVNGNELVYEIRIKKSQYPQIDSLIGLFGQEANVGGYHCRVQVFNAGSYAYGQHGSCNRDTGAGEDGHDDGHLVPNGWIYVQLRLSYIWDLVHGSGSRAVTPIALVGAKLSRNGISC